MCVSVGHSTCSIAHLCVKRLPVKSEIATLLRNGVVEDVWAASDLLILARGQELTLFMTTPLYVNLLAGAHTK